MTHLSEALGAGQKANHRPRPFPFGFYTYSIYSSTRGDIPLLIKSRGMEHPCSKQRVIEAITGTGQICDEKLIFGLKIAICDSLSGFTKPFESLEIPLANIRDRKHPFPSQFFLTDL